MPPRAKPTVKIDEDGDGDTDVTVEIDTPPGDPEPNPDLQVIALLVRRMEVQVLPPETRITYAGARETLRGLLP